MKLHHPLNPLLSQAELRILDSFNLNQVQTRRPLDLPLQDEDYTEDIKEVQAFLDKVKKIVRPGCSQEVLNVAVSSMSSLARILSAMSSKPKPRASL
ncbi:unnamed protein product [Camellia sinensis]